MTNKWLSRFIYILVGMGIGSGITHVIGLQRALELADDVALYHTDQQADRLLQAEAARLLAASDQLQQMSRESFLAQVHYIANRYASGEPSHLELPYARHCALIRQVFALQTADDFLTLQPLQGDPIFDGPRKNLHRQQVHAFLQALWPASESLLG